MLQAIFDLSEVFSRDARDGRFVLTLSRYQFRQLAQEAECVGMREAKPTYLGIPDDAPTMGGVREMKIACPSGYVVVREDIR